MHRALLLLGVLALAGSLPAQTLVNSLPTETLVYFRGGGSFDDLNDIAGNKALWSSPMDLQKSFLDQMDQGMEAMESMFGIPGGSLGTWLRSVKQTEGALFRLDIGGGAPDLDWVLAFETPMAEEIHDTTLKILEKTGAMFDSMGEGEDRSTEVSIGNEFGMNLAYRDDRIVLASSASRLRQTMNDFGQVVAGGLAQNADYKWLTQGDHSTGLGYLKPSFLIDLVGGWMGRAGPSRQQAQSTMLVDMLGLKKLTGAAWCEGKDSTRIALKASGPVPMFELFAAPGTGPELLKRMPANTFFGVSWTGNAEVLWKKASSWILDPQSFPMAVQVEEQLRDFQKASGLKVEEIAAALKNGFAIGGVPDENGEIDDERSVFLMVNMANAEEGRNIASRILGTIAQRNGGKLTVQDVAGVTHYRMTDAEGNPVDDMGLIAAVNEYLVWGQPKVVDQVVSTVLGQQPTLGSVGALKGLKQTATGYAYLGLKAIFENENDFSAAVPFLASGAGVAASIDVKADRVELVSTVPATAIFATFGMAAGLQEQAREQRRECQANLKKIHEAYKTFRAASGEDPKTLSQLGLSGENAVSCPLESRAGTPAKPYMLLPMGPAESDENPWRTVLVYCQHTAHGRIICSREGYTQTWPEARFRKAYKLQKGIK